MADLVLEFNDACMEHTGYLNPGRIKFSDQTIVFKNMKSGRMEQIQASEIDLCQWIRLAGKPAIKIVTKNGSLYRFGGFSDSDFEKLKHFAKRNWGKELEQADTSVKGWNYGVTKFQGNSMEFIVENQPCFEIPLQNVSNCTAGKNEVALEFHQNDDCPVSLMELRFHIPTNEYASSEDPVEDFRRKIMQYAGIIQETGKALAVLDQILCTTPRGRYDIKLYPTFLALHGKTFDYKIPISTILRLFLLPHRDGRRMFFVISLDPPIKQGQTRYHFLICEFMKDEEIELELGLSEEVLREKYEGSLQHEMKGPLYEVVSRIMKTLVKKKITVPGSFVGHSGTPAVSCAYKSAAGFLYPLEKGFMYIHKPPMHIRQEEIACVNFARSDVSTRTFDFEIETKNGNSFTFTSIEKEEYGKLFDFVNAKRLRIKNVGKKIETSAKENFFEGSDDDETDHYAEQLKHEAKEKEEQDDDSESSDEDYKPENDKAGSDEPEEEFDSKAEESSSGDESGKKESSRKKSAVKRKREKSAGSEESDKSAADSGGGSESEDEEPSSSEQKSTKPKAKPSKPSKVANTTGGKKKREAKRKKDPNAPKKPQSSYMLWFIENREKIKQPGMGVAEVAKKGGETWREMKDKSKWEKMAEEEKKRYAREMDEYKKSGGGSTAAPSSKTASKSTSNDKKKSAAAAASSSKKSPIKAKSDEFVATDDDTSSSEDDKKKKKANKKSDEDEEEEEASETTPASSEASE